MNPYPEASFLAFSEFEGVFCANIDKTLRF